MLFAAVKHSVEGLSREAMLMLRVKKYLICLAGTGTTTVSIMEEQSILFLKKVNKK
jgi:hypothetical protein